MSPTESVDLVAARLRIRPGRQSDDDEVCLRLEGQLDGDSALSLARVLLDAQRAGSVLVLDLSRLSFVDVAGLRVLVDAARRAAAAGCELFRARRRRTCAGCSGSPASACGRASTRTAACAPRCRPCHGRSWAGSAGPA